MFDSLLDNTSVPLLLEVTRFASARHRAILSNVANAETPGYVTQDVSASEFRRQLQEASEARDRRPAEGLAFRDSAHNRVDSDGRLRFTAFAAPDAGPARPDGNNVNLEREMVALTRNTMLNNVTLELLRKQFATIRAAISERV